MKNYDLPWLVLIGLLFVLIPQPTLAAPNYNCGNQSSGHCEAIAQTDGYSNIGIYAAINTTQLVSNPPGYVITNEIWDDDSGGDWIETGEITDTYAAQRYFWADQFPNGNFYLHYLANIPAADFGHFTYYEIISNCSSACGSWYIGVSGYSDYYSGTSTDNIFMSNVFMGLEIGGSSGAYSPFTNFTSREILNTLGVWNYIYNQYSIQPPLQPANITVTNSPTLGDFFTWT